MILNSLEIEITNLINFMRNLRDKFRPGIKQVTEIGVANENR